MIGDVDVNVRLTDRALEGEPVEFAYKGVLFRVVPEVRPTKLARLTGQTVVAPDSELEVASQELLKQTETEWEKDWSEL